MNGSAFAGYHPLVNYLFFGYVVLVTALFPHPVFLAISFAAALGTSACLARRSMPKFGLLLAPPLMALAVVFNVCFTHRGVTILGYLPSGNPLTLESLLYGAASALMIGGVVLWCACYGAVMTSDKFLYLFGRVVPAMSLILSMALRFLPRYRAQAARIASARRGIGMGVSSPANPLAKLRAGGEILSVMVTWALENAIETSDSMRARGYGLPGRTAYANYRLDDRDRGLLVVFVVAITILLVLVFSRIVSVSYYPVFVMNAGGASPAPTNKRSRYLYNGP